MPKRIDICNIITQSTNYSDSDDENNGSENDISDSDYEDETSNKIYEHLPSLSQILIVARLIGKREYILCRNGTKKFFNKVCQYQELSQIDKPNDLNYGSRLGKAAEILCKLAAICEIIRISIEVLELLRSQNQLHYEDTSLTFIRNVTSFIENKYPSSNGILEIQSSSCDLAGRLVCSHLLKMLLALYDVEPIVPNVKKNKVDSSSKYINTTSRAIVHMKAFPSEHVLNDPIKHNLINQLFGEVKLNLTTYMSMLCNSHIKDKQVLTANGKQMLLLPEHKLLYEHLKRKYPDRNFDEKTPAVVQENTSDRTANETCTDRDKSSRESQTDSNLNEMSNSTYNAIVDTTLDINHVKPNQIEINKNSSNKITDINSVCEEYSVTMPSSCISPSNATTTILSTFMENDSVNILYENRCKESNNTNIGISVATELNSNLINVQNTSDSNLNSIKQAPIALTDVSSLSIMGNINNQNVFNSQTEHNDVTYNENECNSMTNPIESSQIINMDNTTTSNLACKNIDGKYF
ncbi:unnamed protein product [Rotaria sp. Silwood1]|nr:unnamed protein product [Rotaria sp. Silwood1]CAF4891646.1 unnamed protein product [Rotaria sp. Silwood1]